MSADDGYRAYSIKRSRRTKADIAAIRDAIIDVVTAEPPVTIRQCFYQPSPAAWSRKPRQHIKARSSA